MKLGEKIKELRLQKGLTQKQLAKKAKISSSYISKIENGHANLNLENIKYIFAALETKIPLDLILDMLHDCLDINTEFTHQDMKHLVCFSQLSTEGKKYIEYCTDMVNGYIEQEKTEDNNS